MSSIKKRIITGNIVASSNDLRNSISQRFKVVVYYRENPIGFTTKSVRFRDREPMLIIAKRRKK